MAASRGQAYTLKNLLAEHGIAATWLQNTSADPGRLPHLDLWGRKLSLCGDPVTDREFVADMRRWRARCKEEAGPRQERAARTAPTTAITVAAWGPAGTQPHTVSPEKSETK